MIVALLLLVMSTEKALRVAVVSAFQFTAAQVHGTPAVLSETRQPDWEFVAAMDAEVPDAALREEMVKPHAPVSLRSVFKLGGQRLTTPQEIESLIGNGTPEERVARFKNGFRSACSGSRRSERCRTTTMPSSRPSGSTRGSTSMAIFSSLRRRSI